MLNGALQRAVAAAAGVPDAGDLHVVQCSSSGATGAIIFHGWVRGQSHPRVVVKTPRDTRLNHALRHEWQQVSAVRSNPQLAACVPAALSWFVVDEAEYYAYAGAPGRTMYSRYRNRIVASRPAMLQRFAGQARELIVRVHRTATRPVAAQDVARDLLVDLVWLERSIEDFPATVSERGRSYAERLASTRLPLPSGRVHGDFSPYNVLTASMELDADSRLIDWEHSEPERPQHLDVFRFVSACLLLGLRGRARLQGFREMSGRAAPLLQVLLRPWLEALGGQAAATAWMQPERLEALWWHYWIHAARREQERRARPDDYRDATYLPGLDSLASETELPMHCRSGAFAC